MIPSQKPVWDRKHGDKEHEGLRYKPSPLATLVEPKFPRNSRILDLGCGVGRDAVFFEGKGHRVLATDISDVVIDQDKEHFADTTVEFTVLDMQKALPYKSESFDVIYANLSLHYYGHQKTREIIEEIAKVLKEDGLIAFACKSLEDVNYGNGREVEKDIFVADSGHVRHLFSITYTKELLEGLFDIELLDEIEEVYNGKKSNIVRCVAKKISKN